MAVDTVTEQRVYVGSDILPVGPGGIQYSKRGLVQEQYEFPDCYFLTVWLMAMVGDPITVSEFVGRLGSLRWSEVMACHCLDIVDK